MSPPGKNSGETTWQSVAITMRPGGIAICAPSLPRAQPFVVERAHEELVDELRRRAAAAAVRHVDAAVLEVDGPDVAGADRAHATAAATTGTSLKRPYV